MESMDRFCWSCGSRIYKNYRSCLKCGSDKLRQKEDKKPTKQEFAPKTKSIEGKKLTKQESDALNLAIKRLEKNPTKQEPAPKAKSIGMKCPTCGFNNLPGAKFCANYLYSGHRVRISDVSGSSLISPGSDKLRQKEDKKPTKQERAAALELDAYMERLAKKPTKQESAPKAKSIVEGVRNPKAYSSYNLDKYTWEYGGPKPWGIGMPKPKKEDVGLDSQVRYPYEGRAVEQYNDAIKAIRYATAIIPAISIVFFKALVGGFDLSFGWIFSHLLGATLLACLCGFIIDVFFWDRGFSNDKPSKFESAEWFRNFIGWMKDPSLPNLMRYELTLKEFMRIKAEQDRLEIERLERDARLEREKKAAREAKEKVWREALAKKKAIHDSFTGKGNYRPNARELLSILDSKTGEDLEIIVLGMLRAKGWEAVLTGKGADGGVDVEGVRQNRNHEIKIAVQVKHWTSNVTEKAVRDFWGAATGLYNEALFVTSSDFNSAAIRFKDKRAGQSGTTLRYWSGSQLQAEIDQLTDKEFQEMINPLQTKLAKNALGEEALRPLLDDDTQGGPIRRHSRERRRGPSCPLCGSSMSIQVNRNDGHRFYGCVNYRRSGCRGTIDKP